MIPGTRSPYQFRKQPDGSWQRRHVEGGHWFDLHVERIEPTGNPRNKDHHPAPKMIWTWK